MIADTAPASSRVSSAEEIYRQERDRQLDSQPRESSAEEIQDQDSQNQRASQDVRLSMPIQKRLKPSADAAAQRKEEIASKLLAIPIPPTITLGDLIFMSP